MRRNDEIKQLQKTIREASKQIDKIQRDCPHDRVRLKEGPDIYCGWGSSKTCLDCGKAMGCSTSHGGGKPVNRIIRKGENNSP